MSSTKRETVLDFLTDMTVASMERTELDQKTLMLVRLAALASVDAPPISYVVNLGVGGQTGIEAEDVQQVLIGIAPVVGTARIASAADKIGRVLGVAIAVADAEVEEEAIHAKS